jgi:guanylate kinase
MDRILVTVSGSSGVGKDSVVREALPRLSELGIGWGRSVVTRPPRPNDDPAGYTYVDRDTFLHLINDSDIMEFAEVQGEMYGTPSDVFDAGPRGCIKILTVDGVRSIRRWMVGHSAWDLRIFSVYLTGADLVIRRRLRRRGWDDERIDERRSYDIPGYGTWGVAPEDAEIWHLIIENSVLGERVAADILVAAVESLLCPSSPEPSTKLTSSGSTTSAPESLWESGTEVCSRRHVRGQWPPSTGSGSTPTSPLRP